MTPRSSSCIAGPIRHTAVIQQRRRNMKSKIVILASVVALLTLPSQFAAQDNRNHISQKYHHYKLIDLGTLGGAQSTVTVGRALNNQGTVVGCA